MHKQQKVTESIEQNYMPYSAYVILHRALPEIDGLKVSQRRILYTMYKMGLLKGQRKKSQSIVGQTMFLHPHGDGSIYETLVKMAKDNESLLNPYIDSKGNFGKRYSRDMQWASARYTEAKLMSLSSELFKDIDKNNVDMIDNYDNTMKEPRLLPVTFPSILTNPTQGTAVSMASEFCSFNLIEIADYTEALINNGGKVVDPIDYIKAPDFPTGGTVIYDKDTFNKIYQTGRGSFKIRAEYEIHKDYIHIKSIPYNTKAEIIMDRVADLVKDGKLKGITDINDIYGVHTKGLKISVRQNVVKELLMQQLFKMTTLEDTFSCNFNVIVNGTPKVLGVKDILLEWIKFRAKCIKRSSTYDLEKKQAQLHLLKGLEKVLLNIDEAVAIIRNTRKNSEVIANLSTSFDIDLTQAEYVADIKLRNLNEEYILDKTNNIKTLEAEIEDLTDIISNKRRIADNMIEDLQRVKKQYGQPRKTAIINVEDIKQSSVKEIEVEDYNVKVYITSQNYIKKVALTSLRGQSQHKLKDGDSVVSEFDVTNKGEILCFTSKRNLYKIRLHELPDHKVATSLGEFLPSFLGLTSDEKILYICATSDFKESMIVGFENGKVAKISSSSYMTKQNRKVLSNAYSDKSTPIFFKLITEDIDLLAVSDQNKAILLNTSVINYKGSRTSQGNQFQKHKSGKTVGYYTLDQCSLEDENTYRVSAAGIGKNIKDTDKVNI